MQTSKTVKLIETLILLNTYNYDLCRDYIESLDKEWANDIRFKVINALLDMIDFVRQDSYVEIPRIIEQIDQMMQEIGDDDFDRRFKELVDTVIQEFNNPSLGFPRRKIFINWHMLV